jgi:hypothetical protein
MAVEVICAIGQSDISHQPSVLNGAGLVRGPRWSEEVLLLREEMRRVLEWHPGWWAERKNLRVGLSRDVQEGMTAYACKQAHMNSSFNHMWRSSEELISLGIRADNDILDLGLAATADILHVAPRDCTSLTHCTYHFRLSW